jgi:hypothetical protein
MWLHLVATCSQHFIRVRQVVLTGIDARVVVELGSEIVGASIFFGTLGVLQELVMSILKFADLRNVGGYGSVLVAVEQFADERRQLDERSAILWRVGQLEAGRGGRRHLKWFPVVNVGESQGCLTAAVGDVEDGRSTMRSRRRTAQRVPLSAPR